MDFKVREGTCNTRKYFWSPWFAAKKTFWILDVLQWLKQHSNSFYFEALSFLSFVSLSSFCYAKKWGVMPSPNPPPPSLVSSALIIYQKGSMELNFEGPKMQKWNIPTATAQRVDEKNRVICPAIMFTLGVLWCSLKCQKWYIFCIFYGWRWNVLSKMFKCTWNILLSSFRKW